MTQTFVFHSLLFIQSHIQNSKKRLYTILKSPTKPAHIKALADHFHIIKDRAEADLTKTLSVDDDSADSARDGAGTSLPKSSP